MADPVKTPSNTPNQPAVDSAVATPSASPAPSQASATPASATPPVEPKVEAPAAAAPVEAATPPAVTDAQAAALVAAGVERVAADKLAADTAAAAAAAPETYDIKPSEAIAKAWAAEGRTLDPALIPALTPALKKAGVTASQFQEVAGAFLEYSQGAPAKNLERDLQTVAKDPVLGGANYGNTLAAVKVASEAFADPGYLKLMNDAGLANHPEVVRVFQRIGAAMLKAKDSPPVRGPDAAPAETRAQRMYGRKSQT